MMFRKYIITGKLRKKNNRIIKQTIPLMPMVSEGFLYAIYSAMLTEKNIRDKIVKVGN